jgi:hypothetical protein
MCGQQAKLPSDHALLLPCRRRVSRDCGRVPALRAARCALRTARCVPVLPGDATCAASKATPTRVSDSMAWSDWTAGCGVGSSTSDASSTPHHTHAELDGLVQVLAAKAQAGGPVLCGEGSVHQRASNAEVWPDLFGAALQVGGETSYFSQTALTAGTCSAACTAARSRW